MVPEAPLEQTDAGLVPAGDGWFVVNARDARWIRREGRGHTLPFTGWTDEEAESWFPRLGMNITVLGAGEPIGMYHWEADPEDFLILSGTGILLVEGEERPLGQWDFVHCPPRTEHMIVGGENGCTRICVSSREFQDGEWGAYVPDDLARRYGVSVDETTSDSDLAYAKFPGSEPVRYSDGLLPE